MAIGTYILPICDGCKLPWLPFGWSQDSDPRNLPSGAKSLRCGKCKSSGWDRVHNAEMRKAAVEVVANPFDPTKTIEMPCNVALNEALDKTLNRGEAQLDAQRSPKPSDAGSTPVSPASPQTLPECHDDLVSNLSSSGEIPEPRRTRCKHRMNDCPICNPKEAA